MLKDKTIGILGGIGPESTAIFYLDLIKAIQKNFELTSTKDYPHIIIISISIADLINKDISEDDIKPILNGLKQLDKFHPDFNLIVCNSSNAFYNYLSSNTETKILNLREIVSKYMNINNIDNIGIVGTFLSTNSVYNFADKKVFVVSEEQEALINNLITDFNRGEYTDQRKNELKSIIEDLLYQGAERVLLACTELGLIGRGISNTIDPMQLLLDDIISRLKE